MNPLEEDLGILLDWLCRDWGFCIASGDKLRIKASKRLEAREFAIEVLRAEGFDQPESEVKWIRRLKARFTQYFGMAVVSADGYEGRKNSK